MRRVSLVVVVLIALGTLPSFGEQLRGERPDRGAFDRFVRVVRSILRLQTNGDVLTPPLPAPRP
jgi:hypothetical protein